MEIRKPRKERPPVIRITDAAAERLRELMDNAEDEIVGLRIGVKNAGCAGMAYTMDMVAEPDPLDERVDDKGVSVFVDGKAVMFLLGTEMDYKVDALSAQFVFNNPNQTDACGCGESVAITPVQLD